MEVWCSRKSSSMFKSWVDGEETQFISIQDRGLLYGDGFFTTIAVKDARPYLLEFHLERIRRSSERLFLNLSMDELEKNLLRFLKEMPQAGRFILKVIVTRGEGRRSYRISEDSKSRIILELFEFQGYEELKAKRADGLKVSFCHQPISHQPSLAGIKHLNRLENVLLASEPHLTSFHEAFVFDVDGFLVEGLSSNIFLLKDDVLYTPVLDKAGVEGVVKAWVKSELKRRSIAFVEKQLIKENILQADAIFMTNCIIGVCKVSSIDQHSWQFNEVKMNNFFEQLDLVQVSF